MSEPSSPIRLSTFPRKVFDAVEAPVAKATESVMGTDTFMDGLALTWRLQRSAARRVGSGTEAAIRRLGVPTRRDQVDLVNQIARLQRELRELRREIETRG